MSFIIVQEPLDGVPVSERVIWPERTRVGKHFPTIRGLPGAGSQ
jgi:hypothetical protein